MQFIMKIFGWPLGFVMLGCYLVTGSNGNSIFLPAAGYKENSSHTEVGEYGYYWSSTPQSNSNLGAYYLYMSSSSKLSYYYARVAGQSVRAVSE